MTSLDPKVWGPHYWFFLHTAAMTFPHSPNAISKKKYYDLIQNLPLFIPQEEVSSYFSKLLDEYPVTSYLDNRESIVRWTWFIHNKINEKLEKPKITLEEFYIKYYENYKTKDVTSIEFYKLRSKIIYLIIIFLLIFSIYYFFNK